MVGFLKSIRLYLIVGILSFLFFVVYLLPANVIWKYAKTMPQVAQQGVVLNNVNGTVWAGEAQISLKGNSLGKVQWDINFLSLLLAKASVDVEIKHKEYSMSGTLSKGLSGLAIAIESGQMNAAFLNEHLKQQRVKLSNKIKAKNIVIAFEPGNGFVEGEGVVRWLGGNVEFYNAGKMQKTVMPKLRLKFETKAKQLVAKLANEQKQTVAEITIKPDGWANVGIKKRLAQLAGQKIPGSASPDETVFNVEKKVF